MSETYRERFDRVLAEKELIAVRTWDGNTGWGGIWGRMSHYDRRCTVAGAAIAIAWFAALAFGFHAMSAG